LGPRSIADCPFPIDAWLNLAQPAVKLEIKETRVASEHLPVIGWSSGFVSGKFGESVTRQICNRCKFEFLHSERKIAFEFE
jgi:hypothetical protein